jgi:hypothetical protein
MTDHLEELHYRATEANLHFTKAITTFHDPLTQTTATLQCLHEVIAAIDAIYLHLKDQQEP